MSSAPKGSYNSWVLPDGRFLVCAVELSYPSKRAYSITVDGNFAGIVIRWSSIGRWRAQTPDEEWVRGGGEDPPPSEWLSRGDAVDQLVKLHDES